MVRESWYPIAGHWPTDAEFIGMMRESERWPAHPWCRIDKTALALKNDKTGALGIIFGERVKWRDRLTVYEVNIFDHATLVRVATSTEPSGVPEHKYIDFEGMFDAGWRPD